MSTSAKGTRGRARTQRAIRYVTLSVSGSVLTGAALRCLPPSTWRQTRLMKQRKSKPPMRNPLLRRLPQRIWGAHVVFHINASLWRSSAMRMTIRLLALSARPLRWPRSRRTMMMTMTTRWWSRRTPVLPREPGVLSLPTARTSGKHHSILFWSSKIEVCGRRSRQNGDIPVSQGSPSPQ